jgi:hypothetical protein
MRKALIIISLIVLSMTTACAKGRESDLSTQPVNLGDTAEIKVPSQESSSAPEIEVKPYEPVVKSKPSVDISKCIFYEKHADDEELCITKENLQNIPEAEANSYKMLRIIKELNDVSKKHATPLDYDGISEIIRESDTDHHNDWRSDLSDYSISTEKPSENIMHIDIVNKFTKNGTIDGMDAVSFYVNLKTGEFTQ